jgi:hypothetical protein
VELAKIREDDSVPTEAQCRVAEFRGLIENQRQLIEESNQRGYDVTSPKIVLESLLISLSMYTQGLRHDSSLTLSGLATAPGHFEVPPSLSDARPAVDSATYQSG